MQVVRARTCPTACAPFAVLVRQLALNQQLVKAAPTWPRSPPPSATPPSGRLLEPAQPFRRSASSSASSWAFVYVSLLVYGQMVAQGVVGKVEPGGPLLLTAIRPWQLMLGKLAGIGVVGLVQLAVAAAGVSPVR